MDILSLNDDSPQYSIDTESLGRIDLLPLTVRRLKTLGKIDQASGSEFVESLLTAIGRQANGNEIENEQAVALSEIEKEAFAEAFLEHNQYLFRERVTKRRKNDAGETVHYSELGEVKHPRKEGETPPDYLLRVFKLDLETQNERMRAMMEPYATTLAAHKNLFTPPFIESLKASQSAQARLRDMIGQMHPNLPGIAGLGSRSPLGDSGAHVKPSEAPLRTLPEFKNPIDDTNKSLQEVVDRLEEMNALAVRTAETVGSVSNSATEFLVAFGAASDDANRASRRAIKIAGAAIAVALISTVIQIGYAEWRDYQHQVSTDRTVTEIINQMKAMVDAQHTNTQQLSERLDKENQAIAESLNRLSDTISTLEVQPAGE